MKKNLLTLVFGVAVSLGSLAQLAIPGPFDFNNVAGGSVTPLFQGSAGTYEVQAGVLLPQITGTLNSVSIDAILTASVNDTYANDIMILVTSSEDLSQQANYLLQIGGFSGFVPTNKFSWGCEPACDVPTPNTPVAGTVSAFAGMDFTNSTMIIWLANGYVNANPPTNEGSWTVNSLSFGGVSLATSGVEENVAISRVYPNPTENTLNVELNAELASVNVISLDGKTVVSQEMNGTTSVDVSAIKTGSYILEAITVKGEVVRTNFIKK